jgi:hypothetical protein
VKLWTPSRDIWRKPPVGLAQINWSHPLARGLVGCWLHNECAGNSVLNLVTNIKSSFTGIYVSWHVNGLNFNGGTDYWSCLVTGSQFPFDGSGRFRNGTILSRFRYDSATSSARGIFSVGNSDTSGTPSFLIQNASGTIQCYCADNGGYFGGTSLAINTWMSIALQNDGSNHNFYTDGIYRGQRAVGSGTPQRNNLYCGAGFSSGTADNTKVSYVYFYNRALSASEIRQTHLTPYCFLQPIVTKTYYVIGGGTQSQSQTGAGGAVAGGSATQVQAQTFPAAGGGVAGGAATQLQAPTNPASGGAIAGGAATQEQTHTPAFSASGGAVAGGAATQAQTYSPAFSATGGAVAGGTADQLQAATFPTSGGAVAGGTATQSSTGSYAFVASGGAVAGGAVGQLQASTFPASGGGVAGGAAITEGINAGAYAFEASGGAVAGGSADQIQAKTNPASGGGVAGGTATVSTYQLQAVSFSASGGGIAGGAATVTRTLSSTIQEYPFSPASSTEGEFPFYQPREDDFFPASSAGDEFEPYIPRG